MCVQALVKQPKKKEVFKDLNLSIYESKELARPKCDPQDTCRTPCAQPKKPDRQEATHECPEECATRHFPNEPFWQETEIVVERRAKDATDEKSKSEYGTSK